MRRSLLALAVAALSGCAADPADGGGPLTTRVADWRDEVIYQIVVDRFDNADPSNDSIDGVATVPGDLSRHQGGDWRGVQRRLGYIKRLGATAIWLSPVVANVARTDRQDGYHGYWASDFTRVNRRYGSLADLRSLVDAAHQRDVKVIIDVVVNHAGRVFFYDFDGDGRPGGRRELEPGFSKSGPYRVPLGWLTRKPDAFVYADRDHVGAEPLRMTLSDEHFHRRGQTDDQKNPRQKEAGDFPTGLRDLDTERDDVVRAMVDTTLRWIELTDVDGIRLDAVPHVPHAFWARFARELRAALAARGKDRFLLLGEVFDGDPRKLASYTNEGGLDSVFDFSLKWEGVDGYILDGNPAATVRGALGGYRGHYAPTGHPLGVGLSPWQARVAMASNHDMPRLRYWLDDPYAAELAMTLVFAVDAVPAVYYGVEQELKGGWGDASREPLWRAAGFREHTRMYRHIAALARLRREQVALRRGALVVRYASEISARQRGPGAGLLAFERVAGEARVLVALNAHPQDAARATVQTGFAPGTVLTDVLGTALASSDGGGGQLAVGADGSVALNVRPRRALILAPR